MSARFVAIAACMGAIGFALIAGNVLYRETRSATTLPFIGYYPIPAVRSQLIDRHGTPLNTTQVNDWNLHDTIALYQVPQFLLNAFIQAEDQRFFQHPGQDWAARLSALQQNVWARQVMRGASTITEQVVRMLHPRPRTPWSRWLEGWEAERLEDAYSKTEILEFYLNQVPYAANRRGIASAARYYFNRDLETLNVREMLALACMVRAPSSLDLFTGEADRLNRAIERLANAMVDAGYLGEAARKRELAGDFDLQRPGLPVNAWHFLRYIRAHYQRAGTRLRTTLDGGLQRRLQGLLDQRLHSLANDRVANAAMLVADHQSGEILAWVVGGAGDDAVPAHMIDTVITPRQPGSALKPFLYALALESGWTAATLIEDTPLTERVGRGSHSYQNYSHQFYGRVTLRQALGNSLNIPAVRTIQRLGSARYLALLHQLGFSSLSQDAGHYGPGLALGNSEVSLLELVQAYGALANRGVYRKFGVIMEETGSQPTRRIYTPATASLLGNILSDPDARRREFGSASLLNLPQQSAVKTGTSSDYRDSWAVGYNDRYVVGVWMGNLDQTPTSGITGSRGPAFALRGAFDLLNRHRESMPLWLSPKLQRRVICADTGIAYHRTMTCPRRSEYFIPGTAPAQALASHDAGRQNSDIRLRQPTPGLHMAYDPRLPASHQGFEFVLQGVEEDDIVEWHVDQKDTRRRAGGRYLWPLSRGHHAVSATVWRRGEKIAAVGETRFLVK